MSGARLSPTGRGSADVNAKVKRLEQYEQWKSPTRVDFESIVESQEWERYWSLCEAVNDELRKAQQVADALRVRIVEGIRGKAAR